MHLVQILLPLKHPQGGPQPRALFAQVRRELVERFGGLTAYTRAPAEGLWEHDGGALEHDEVCVYEVMVPELDRPWWQAYGQDLAERFGQQEMVLRAHAIERL